MPGERRAEIASDVAPRMELGHAPADALLHDATIAVIDDDDDTRDALTRRLERAGYRVAAYDDAAEALVDMEHAPPALIILDLMMPGMDGWQFRVEQRKRPSLSEVPVVVTSGDVSPYAAAIDAAAYLTKPIDFDRLRNVVDHALLAAERNRLAAKAVEFERVRQLGMLVAGVAHEINNPLTYLIANLDMAGRVCTRLETGQPLPDGSTPQLRRALDAASEGAQRIAFVVRLLSTFGRGEVDEVSPVDPLRALDAAIRLAAHHIDGRARLITRFEACPYVMANESRLAQLFLNLLVNAGQAIPEGHPEQHEIAVTAWGEGDRVVFEIADTGSGIEPQFLPRIFDNFFTTKPAGQGIGLGLSISRDIAQSLGGSIAAESELGKGSTFRVELPVVIVPGTPPRGFAMR